jgi:hypothetical protein
MPKASPHVDVPMHTKPSLGLEEFEKRTGDPQEVRALELEAAGLTIKAQRVRECGIGRGVRAIRTCKIRGCPRCAARTRAAMMPWIHASLAKMKKPRVGVLNILSKTKKGLGRALDVMHESLANLRRCMKRLGIVRVVGAIEAVITKDGKRWNAHVHIVLDCRRAALRRLRKFWKKATAGRGHFVVHDEEFVQDPGGLGNYMSKVDSWCPAPGTMAPDDLGILLDALKGRHLHFRWGFQGERVKPKVWVIARLPSRHRVPRFSRPDRSQTNRQERKQESEVTRIGGEPARKSGTVLSERADLARVQATGLREAAARRRQTREQQARARAHASPC